MSGSREGVKAAISEQLLAKRAADRAKIEKDMRDSLNVAMQRKFDAGWNVLASQHPKIAKDLHLKAAVFDAMQLVLKTEQKK
jgi:hypothetical protein